MKTNVSIAETVECNGNQITVLSDITFVHFSVCGPLTDRFLTGQNLYQFSENLVRDGSNWDQAIMAWYDEVARFSPRSVDYFE